MLQCNKYFGKKKKAGGFTIIELLITLGMLSVIASLIISVFIVGLKAYYSVNNERELQFQARYILSFMHNKIAKSRSIDVVRYNVSSYMKKSGVHKINRIAFRYGSKDDDFYIFENKFNKVFYDTGKAVDSANVELGDYVTEMYACPFPEDVSFEDAAAVKIMIVLLKGKQKYEAEETIYMRNNQ